MIPIWENLILVGQICPAAIDQRHHGQMALLGNFLGTQMFFHGHRIIGAAFHRSIIANHHNLASMHCADTGDEPSAGCRALVHTMGSGGPNF